MKNIRNKKLRGLKPNARKNRKRTSPREALGRVFLVIGFILLASVTGVGATFMGLKVRELLFYSTYFAITEFEIHAGEKMGREEILALSGLEPGQNILMVDLDEVARRIGKSPWIKEVKVHRVLPDKVIIKVKERRTSALLSAGGLFLLDKEGFPFKEVSLGDVVNYPVIVSATSDISAPGENEDIEEALEILSLAKESDFLPASKVSEFLLDYSGITLFTSGELLKVEFGHGDIKRKWQVLEAVLAEVKRSGALPHTINLCHSNGAAVEIWRTSPKVYIADRRNAVHD